LRSSLLKTQKFKIIKWNKVLEIRNQLEWINKLKMNQFKQYTWTILINKIIRGWSTPATTSWFSNNCFSNSRAKEPLDMQNLILIVLIQLFSRQLAKIQSNNIKLTILISNKTILITKIFKILELIWMRRRQKIKKISNLKTWMKRFNV
jgi:hypothetical protein